MEMSVQNYEKCKKPDNFENKKIPNGRRESSEFLVKYNLRNNFVHLTTILLFELFETQFPSLLNSYFKILPYFV